MEREACVCDHGYERSDLCAEIIIIIIRTWCILQMNTLLRTVQCTSSLRFISNAPSAAVELLYTAVQSSAATLCNSAFQTTTRHYAERVEYHREDEQSPIRFLCP